MSDNTNSVEIVELTVQATLTMKFKAPPQELGAKLGEVLPACFALAQKRGVALAGVPFARYLKHDTEAGVFHIEAGVPIADPVEGSDEIQASELPGGRAASYLHVGPYQNLGDAHELLVSWAEAQSLVASGGPWESYVSDPSAEPDTSKWETRLFLPVG